MNDFEALGAQFRQARENRELSLQDVEKQSRIRLKFLQAIEYGQFHLIDTPIQLQGFLRQYAKCVGLDAEMVIAQYEQAMRQNRGKIKKAPLAPPSTPTGPYRPTVPPLAANTIAPPNPELYTASKSKALKPIFAVILALLFAGGIVGGAVVMLNNWTAETEETPEAGIEVLVVPDVMESPTSTATLNIPPTVLSQPVINPGETLYISLTIKQRLWLRVMADGVVVFDGLLRPGDAVGYPANETLTVRTSNAGGLDAYINNQPYSFGSGREAVERTFTAGGIPTPTGEPSSTPTVSLTPSITLTSQATITATITNTASPETQTSLFTATLLFTPALNLASSPTPLPTFGFSTNTPTATTSPLAPTAAPTMTPSPFLPPRETRTPSSPK